MAEPIVKNFELAIKETLEALVFNPLEPRRTQVSPITEISILFWEGIIKKNFLWASRLWVGRRKEPILGYVPKNYEKKNSVHKGLRRDHQKFSCESVDEKSPKNEKKNVPKNDEKKKNLIHKGLNLYCLNSFFVIFCEKIGSFRLPTHSRDAHRKFFWSYILKLKWKFLLIGPIWEHQEEKG